VCKSVGEERVRKGQRKKEEKKQKKGNDKKLIKSDWKSREK
jgi:hypothetical protein